MGQRLVLICNRIKDDIKANGAGLAAVAACFAAFAFLFGDVCPTQILFGLPCPACGLTRAGVCVLLGLYERAWDLNPFIYGWIFVILVACWQRYVRGKKMGKAFWVFMGIMIGAMLIFYIYRMWRYFPYQEPMTFHEDGIFSEYIAPLLPEDAGQMPSPYYDMVK